MFVSPTSRKICALHVQTRSPVRLSPPLSHDYGVRVKTWHDRLHCTSPRLSLSFFSRFLSRSLSLSLSLALSLSLLLSLPAPFKTKSQPSLLTRRVSHTDLHSATALPRTQSLCSGSRHGLSSTSRAVTPTIPAIPLRPGSSLPISRMEDEAASRPLSRVMSRMQNQQTDKTQVHSCTHIT